MNTVKTTANPLVGVHTFILVDDVLGPTFASKRALAFVNPAMTNSAALEGLCLFLLQNRTA